MEKWGCQKRISWFCILWVVFILELLWSCYFFPIYFSECTVLLYMKPTVLRIDFMRKTKITRFTGKCIEVGSTLLSEVNQTHASKHCMFFLKCGSYPRIYVLYVCKQRVSMTNYRYSVRLRSREQGRVTLGNQEGWNVGKGTHESWKNTGLVFLPSSFNLAIFFFFLFLWWITQQKM